MGGHCLSRMGQSTLTPHAPAGFREWDTVTVFLGLFGGRLSLSRCSPAQRSHARADGSAPQECGAAGCAQPGSPCHPAGEGSPHWLRAAMLGGPVSSSLAPNSHSLRGLALGLSLWHRAELRHPMQRCVPTSPCPGGHVCRAGEPSLSLAQGTRSAGSAIGRVLLWGTGSRQCWNRGVLLHEHPSGSQCSPPPPRSLLTSWAAGPGSARVFVQHRAQPSPAPRGGCKHSSSVGDLPALPVPVLAQQGHWCPTLLALSPGHPRGNRKPPLRRRQKGLVWRCDRPQLSPCLADPLQTLSRSEGSVSPPGQGMATRTASLPQATCPSQRIKRMHRVPWGDCCTGTMLGYRPRGGQG